MPELPEVETIMRTLSPYLLGSRITGVNLITPGIIVNPQPQEFIRFLTNRIFTSASRRGKYQIWFLDEKLMLIIHLGMTGRLLLLPETSKPLRHTHLILQLKTEQGKTCFLYYVDPRRFGRIWLYLNETESTIPFLQKLGAEPLSDEVDAAAFHLTLSSRRTTIKSALLNQRCLAGIGNIYADEALFLAGIHPCRPAGSLSYEECAQLLAAIRSVLKAGISHGGTTVRDYVTGHGEEGSHQHYLYVYGRFRQPCLVCGTPIERCKIGSRSSHFCPNCQKYH